MLFRIESLCKNFVKHRLRFLSLSIISFSPTTIRTFIKQVIIIVGKSLTFYYKFHQIFDYTNIKQRINVYRIYKIKPLNSKFI